MEELRLKLIDLCNNSGLTIEALFFVVKDVYRDVNDLYNTYLLQKEKEKGKENSKKPLETLEGEIVTPLEGE